MHTWELGNWPSKFRLPVSVWAWPIYFLLGLVFWQLQKAVARHKSVLLLFTCGCFLARQELTLLRHMSSCSNQVREICTYGWKLDEGKGNALPARQEWETEQHGCPPPVFAEAPGAWGASEGRPWVTGLVINFLTLLSLALQQAFVVQAEPFSPHQRSLACHCRQSCWMSATKESQQAELPGMADWEKGRGLVSGYQL